MSAAIKIKNLVLFLIVEPGCTSNAFLSAVKLTPLLRFPLGFGTSPGKVCAPDQHLLGYESMSFLLFLNSSSAHKFSGDRQVLPGLIPLKEVKLWLMALCPWLSHFADVPHQVQWHLLALWESSTAVGARTKVGFTFTQLIAVLWVKYHRWSLVCYLFLGPRGSVADNGIAWKLVRVWLNVVLGWVLLYDLLKCTWYRS